MKNRSFAARLGFLLLTLLLLQSSFLYAQKDMREFYEIKVYHFTSDTQQQVLDHYFQNALKPALHKAGINQTGFFSAVSNDTASDKRMYVIMPLKSLDEVNTLAAKLENDANYQSGGAEYLDAAYNAAPYGRIETILLRAFPLAPKMNTPHLQGPKNERIYELRSYESPTEKLHANKVKMFNQGGEIDLFKRLNFNAVFYAQVVAGCKMPNLMYMTSFDNMQEREAHWKAFGNDPFWKQLSAMPEYQNNVSHIDIVFLHPAEYSDF